MFTVCVCVCDRGEEGLPESSAEAVGAPGSCRWSREPGLQLLGPWLQTVAAGGRGGRGHAEEGSTDAAVGHTGVCGGGWSSDEFPAELLNMKCVFVLELRSVQCFNTKKW